MNTIHISIIIAEIVLLIYGIKNWKEKNSAMRRLIHAGCVFAITFIVYLLPYIEGYGDYGAYAKWWIYIPECLGATIKQLVGESRIEFVATYMRYHKLYAVGFYLAAILCMLVTFSTALSVFQDRMFNYFRRAKMMKADVCDIVIGQCEIALEYAMLNKNTIVFIDKAKSTEEDSAYIESGYTVLKKNFSAELLKSKLFNKKTRYNFIVPDANENFGYYYNIISIYLDCNELNSNMFFFLETNENAVRVIRDHIAKNESELYSRFVRLFSRNELLSRKFVGENPITKYMPSAFLEDDTSVRKDVTINVMMLGFSPLSKEIYNQFIINNQLVEYADNEYKCHSLNYTIYSSTVDKSVWNIEGLKNSLKELEGNKDMYFPLPELPYNTTVVEKNAFDITEITKMCRIARAENTLTYFIVDVGNIYHNIEISDNINQLMNYKGNYHIFVYNNGVDIHNENNVTFYGNVRELLTKRLIVNEELDDLAKSINKKYYTDKHQGENLTDEEIEKKNIEEWQKMSYFDLYSNIYHANNLRLKLNLLGLDYEKCAGVGDAGKLLEKYDREKLPKKNWNYLEKSIRNAMLAQEHARWNAYHMLSHYMPIKKEKISACRLEDYETNDEFKKAVIASRKNAKTKKHACITTYNGIMAVEEFLAQKINKDIAGETCAARNFSFYENDDLLFDESVTVKYFKSNGYKVVEKARM